MTLLDWLSLLTLPGCALASAVLIGVVHRHDQLEDGPLLRRFIVVLAVCFGLFSTLMQRPDIQMRLHPELRQQAEIDADPIYQALAAVAPEDAARYRAGLDFERAHGSTLAQARLQARSMLAALVTARLQFSNQAAHVAWGQATLDTLRELQGRSADQCYAVLSGQDLDRETLAHGFSAQNTASFEAAVLQVLESAGQFLGGKRPAGDPPADFNATMRDWQGIQDDIAKNFSPEVSALVQKDRLPSSPPLPADTVCAARIDQLDAMLQRPKAAAALMIDSILR